MGRRFDPDGAYKIFFFTTSCSSWLACLRAFLSSSLQVPSCCSSEAFVLFVPWSISFEREWSVIKLYLLFDCELGFCTPREKLWRKSGFLSEISFWKETQ